ncbi:MAG: hypothetical protein ACXV5K_09790, partial [Halobacteriota archaeon]
MKCGVCHATLAKKAEDQIGGSPELWVCKKCYVARELEPYDKPATAAKKELHNKLFAGKKCPRPLREDRDATLADLRAQLERVKNNGRT